MKRNDNFRILGKGPCPAEITETQQSFGTPYRNKKLSKGELFVNILASDSVIYLIL